MTWETLYDAFDPELPVVNRPEWRVARTQGPTERIARWMDLPKGTPQVLLTGTPGSGKSTELYRLAEARADKEFVVLLDLDRHFTEVVGDPTALQRVAAWEVCFLAVLALVRAGEDALGLRFDTEKRELGAAWSRIAKSSQTPEASDLDVGALLRSMAVFASGIAVVAGAAPTAGAGAVVLSLLAGAKEAGMGFRWKLPIGLGRRALPDQDEDLQGLVLVVNRVLGRIQSAHRAVLLIIDGLDRIRELTQARALFVDSTMLARFSCRLVVCGPYALRHRPELAQVRGFRPLTLVNEPVVDQREPWKHGPGIAVFHALFERRAAEAKGLIAAPLLDRLAYYSGGRARDFVRLIRMLAERMMLDDAETPTESHVDDVLDEARRLRETGLNRKHIRVLNDLAADPLRQMPDDPAAWDLLQWDCVLPYPDGSEWFFPHPLLTLNLLRPWPPGSTA
ncbi:MAG: hypothetical protein R3A52_10195 [Polyangiales bacterium]